MKPRRKKPKPVARPRPNPPEGKGPPALVARLQADSVSMLAYRVLVVAMQAATILVTWPLWQVRSDPPMFPALAVPQFSVGPWLLVSLVIVLAAPRVGLAVHAALLGLAMLQDQLRMQPELISMGLLMLGTLSHPSARFIGRTHLVTIWFFAAFHKLICAKYYMHTVPPQLMWLTGDGEPWPTIFDVLRGGVALFEMSLAVLALIPRTRKWCGWQAAIFHLGILQYLMFWLRSGDGRLGWNEAVWPWNIALVPAAYMLIRPWQSTAWDDLRQSGWRTRAVVVFFCIYPFGYYVGLVDAYMAHCLYSINTPAAAIVRPGEPPDQLIELETLHVPFPPVPRIYKRYFDEVAEPGDVLVILDPRRWAKARGKADERFIKLADERGERIEPLPGRRDGG